MGDEATQRWGLHLCALDREHHGDVLHRVHLNTPWFHFAFAYLPKSKFAGRIKEPWLSELLAQPKGKAGYQRRREIASRSEHQRDRWTMAGWHKP